MGNKPDVDNSVLVLVSNPLAGKMLAGYAGKGDRIKESSPASKEANKT